MNIMRFDLVKPASSLAAAGQMHVRARPDAAWTTGVTAVDAVLGGGLARGQLHEIYAATPADATAAAGFTAALAIGMDTPTRPVLWLRSHHAARTAGVVQGEGWAALGGDPGRCLFGLPGDPLNLLRAACDGLRCGGLAAVILESHGRMAGLDLTASRRFTLAAEMSGTAMLLLRIDAEVTPSAARTRWQVAAAPSRAFPGNAPGMPSFDIELLRQKSGPSGMRWRLEWDCDQRRFRDAALSGAVVPVPSRRPGTVAGAGPHRRVA
jgi:protein ImuA